MNTILINILCMFFYCNADKSEGLDLKEGLYYGRNKGFFPQSIVYATINKNSAFVECYLPLKGAFFHTFSDTLILNDKENLLFESEKSSINTRKGKLFFKTIPGKSEYKVEETQITYHPEKKGEYLEIKGQAKSFKE